MAILIEGMTLIFESAKLAAKYPDGVYGFKKTWDNGSFCTDGIISRIAFFEEEDGFCVLAAIQDVGLDICVDYAADVAVFLYSSRPWAPCLWLETETSPLGYTTCWHATDEPGKVSVPGYFKLGLTLTRLHDLSSRDLTSRVRRSATEENYAIFVDSHSKSLFYGPKRLCRH